jgi:transglutaminase-like putative cysteine protease
MAKTKRFNPELIRFILVYWAALTLPLSFRHLLHAGVSVYVILIVISSKLFLELINSLPHIHHTIKKVCSILSSSASLLFAVSLLLCIIVTPRSVYAYFFEAASRPLDEEYFISNLFVLMATFFSMFFASAALKQKSYKPLLGLPGSAFMLHLIMYQTLIYAFLLFAVLLTYVILLLKKRTIPLVKTFILCIIAGLLLYAFKPDPEGSIVVDDFLFPEVRKLVDTYIPQFPLLIDIPGYETGGKTRKLGGIAVHTSTPVFEVQSNRKETLYLKTHTYDRYTGSRWEQSVDSTGHPQDAAISIPAPVETFTGETLRVTIRTEVMLQVPYTIDSIGFEYKGRSYLIPDRPYIPRLALEEGLRKNSVITLYRDLQQKRISGSMDMFLQLPFNLPQSVKELAVFLGENASSHHDVLYNIQSFLETQYMYDLRAPEIRKNEDFLDKFLFTDKRGYCTHFATAFTVLARLNNIPARYATGYLVMINDDSFKKVVTERTAHAWPEIWIAGRGWEIWEATRVVSADYSDRLYGDEYYERLYFLLMSQHRIARNSLTLNQLRDLLGIELTVEEESPQVPAWVTRLPTVLLYMLLIAASAGLLAFLVYMGIRFIFNHLPSRHRKILLNRIVKKFKEVPRPETHGWIAWKNSVCRHYHMEKTMADTLLEVILKTAYSHQQLSDDEIQILKRKSYM